MHGIEHCEQKRRTIRLSAPQRPFSPAPGSMLPGSPLAASCPEPVARNGLLLARNGCHLSATSIPGSKLSACYFASFQVASVPVRPFGSTTASPVCAGGGRFTASGPLHFHYPVRPAALPISVPGPLRFRRLAVPQTSWNLFHYAPHTGLRQRFLCANQHFSSAFILFILNRLRVMPGASPVYKTYPRCLDFAIL